MIYNTLYNTIKNYTPQNEQEKTDKTVMLNFISQNDNCLSRENMLGHFTASSWIVNQSHDKVLFCYHNIYNSWSWVGGHSDGEENQEKVALKEASEETGLSAERIKSLGLISLEALFVPGHEKKGKYVPCHVHFNLTYAIEADENDCITNKPDENQDVRWFTFEEALCASTEPWMVERIYKKLVNVCTRKTL